MISILSAFGVAENLSRVKVEIRKQALPAVQSRCEPSLKSPARIT